MASNFYRKTSRNIGTGNIQVGGTTSSNGYVVGSSKATTIIGLSVSNVAAVSITVSVYHVDVSTNNTYLVKTAPIAVGGTLVVVGGDQKVVMNVGDHIQVISNTAASADVIMSILEVDQA